MLRERIWYIIYLKQEVNLSFTVQVQTSTGWGKKKLVHEKQVQGGAIALQKWSQTSPKSIFALQNMKNEQKISI